MFHIKPHENAADALVKRQRMKMIKMSTNGDFIPLKWNWAETWCSVPGSFQEYFQRIYNFQVNHDDIFISTFPKCGTTWIQEATWLLLNNLDYETANRIHLVDRSVYMDLSLLYDTFHDDSITAAMQLKSPRCIKSHLPAHLLPHQIWQKRVKLVYCARNPKDVVLSYGHFLRSKGAYGGSMQEFIDDFLNAESAYTPFWPHVFTMWQMRSEPNVFFTTFEEMKRDLRGVIKRLNEFLEKPNLSEAQMEKLLNHLSFENMRANQQVNPTKIIKNTDDRSNVEADFQFMRRGIVGSYKDELSETNQRRLNEWSAQFLQEFNLTAADIFGDF
ncbi:sulfotransferase 1 family member D1-like isoform X1 [Anastrepha ludens]|uniref:sulfotransferase 1 family member D1-like isoform X1 n=1 Tax=Anastrepha ludens TaxID=28586 RepID=UPI0023B12418|nr:sulfotransferase 1 family member D1-like isoform X1 [Anastrepha ludens]XP_053954913.1 sulfotransferase 1 family member D1-like isoform X1 [Anastrepha ludens]XP_053954915.1 sulfotransferase 1 family member D1-like isoform X1 [Anastrepha ludens]